MDIFGSIGAPKWLSPDESTKDWTRIASGSNAFSSAFNQAKHNKRQDDKELMAKKEAALETVVAAQHLAPVYESLKGVDSSPAFLAKVKEHPEWLSDRYTAPLVSDYGKLIANNEKIQNDAIRAEAASIAGKVELQDNANFLKDLSSLSNREDRVRIKSISDPVMRERALGLALESDKLAQESLRTSAEDEAIARGDVATTTITPKGVSTTFRPSKTSEGGGEPVTKTLSDGSTLVWREKSGGVQIIRNKKTENMTAPQLLKLAGDLPAGDNDKEAIIAAAKSAAMEQIKPKSPNVPQGTKPAASGYKVGTVYKGGLKYLGGDINDPSSWEQQ
jgi:hypothetical protein